MHSESLYAICLREMNRNPADAEDAQAEAMMRAMNKMPSFAAKLSDPKAWLARLTINVCMDIHRRRTRSNDLALRCQRMGEDNLSSATYGVAGASKEAVLHSEKELSPEFIFTALPKGLREVCVLRFIHQLSHKEIAKRLALTDANARKRVQKARSLLRALQNRGVFDHETERPIVQCPNADIVADRPKRSAEREFAIPALTGFSRTVSVHLLSGEERYFEILFDKKPSREGQKIKTLRKYVERHPGGWKRRLELADLLYGTGLWNEAAEGYRHVLSKHPWLTAVSVRLGEIVSLISTVQEAQAVYERALPLAQNDASKFHLKGLLALGQRKLPLAVKFFQKATLAEPGNAAHHRALAAALDKLEGSS